jgi:hypothetical protein
MWRTSRQGAGKLSGMTRSTRTEDTRPTRVPACHSSEPRVCRKRADACVRAPDISFAGRAQTRSGGGPTKPYPFLKETPGNVLAGSFTERGLGALTVEGLSVRSPCYRSRRSARGRWDRLCRRLNAPATLRPRGAT